MASVPATEPSQLIYLPTDVIELILYSEVIDYLSLIRLSSVCRRLHTIICSNQIWNLQAKRRWRVWRYGGREVRLRPSDSLCIPGVTDWKDLFVNRFVCEKLVFSFLDTISCDYLMLEKFNGLVDDNRIEVAHVLAEQTHLMETLRELIDDEDANLNISRRFYAPSVYNYFKQKQLMLSYTSIFGVDQTSPCTTMEHISIWLDCWMNPEKDLEYFDYSKVFDLLADRVKLKLPDGASECEIISAIDRVMFKEDGYKVNQEFYSHTNSYLHKVLRTKEGIYITLAVIFQAVASRLGLNLFPISFPGYFSLGYRESDGSHKQTQYLSFVDGNRVRKFSERELLHLTSGAQFNNLSSVQTVATRMLANITMNLLNKEPRGEVDERVSFINSTQLLLKLNLTIGRSDRRIFQSLYNACLHLNYNLNKYLDCAHSANTQAQSEVSTDDMFVEIHKRTSAFYHDQEHPIGAIVRLYAGSYGVVCRWDHNAQYGILEDNSIVESKYQYGEITLCPRHEIRPINNILIGKYFSHFNGLYYQPIPPLQNLYPDDEMYLRRFLSSD